MTKSLVHLPTHKRGEPTLVREIFCDARPTVLMLILLGSCARDGVSVNQ